MAKRVFLAKRTLLLKSSSTALLKAAAIIRRGGLVAFPTETVYGLGADALNERAVQKIFRAKGRPQDNPLIVHLSSTGQLTLVACQIPDRAWRLAEHFWPGPLSLILPKTEALPANVSAGLDTVAVRMPAHRTALKLIELCGVPIAAPSANRSGRPSPTSFRHVVEDLSGRIEAIIVDEDCPVGIESTVLDLSGAGPVILRPGGVSREALEEVLSEKVRVAGLLPQEMAPQAPGMKYRHYAPRAPLILITGAPLRRRVLTEELFCYFSSQGLRVGLLNAALLTESASGGPEKFAAALFGQMRRMDWENKDLILAEEIKPQGLGLAIMNRLRKAATRVIKVL